MASQLLELRLVAGFIVLLLSEAILNKVGNIFYRKGIAKPFYLMGYRLHHRSVLRTLIPAAYVMVATFIYLHYVRILWYAFWPSVEITVLLSGICVAFDMALDALSSKEKRTTLLQHEWLYLVVPAYILTHIVALV